MCPFRMAQTVHVRQRFVDDEVSGGGELLRVALIIVGISGAIPKRISRGDVSCSACPCSPPGRIAPDDEMYLRTLLTGR